MSHIKEGYVIRIHFFDELLKLMPNDPNVKKLMDCIPLGTNYYIGPKESLDYKNGNNNENKNGDSPFHSCNYFGIKCSYGIACYHFYADNLTLQQHIDRKYTNELRKRSLLSVVLELDDFKLLEKIVYDKNSDDNLCIIYDKCFFDTTKKIVRRYNTHAHKLVQLLDYNIDENVQKMLDLHPIKAYVSEKKDKDKDKDKNCDQNSYEVLYEKDMPLREHLLMYKRDENICNYNTVNHGISYSIELSRDQFDLLIKTAENNPAISDITISISLDKETDAVTIDNDNKRTTLQRPPKTFEEYQAENKARVRQENIDIGCTCAIS